jgi:hypothetical protein
MKAIAVGLMVPLSLIIGIGTTASAAPRQNHGGVLLVGDINIKDVGGPEDQEDAPVIRSLRPPKPATSTQTTQQPGATPVPSNQDNPPSSGPGGAKPDTASDRPAAGQH